MPFILLKQSRQNSAIVITTRIIALVEKSAVALVYVLLIKFLVHFFLCFLIAKRCGSTICQTVVGGFFAPIVSEIVGAGRKVLELEIAMLRLELPVDDGKDIAQILNDGFIVEAGPVAGQETTVKPREVVADNGFHLRQHLI